MENLTKTDVSKMEYVQKMSDKDIVDYLAEAKGWQRSDLYPGKWFFGKNSVFHENPIGTSFDAALSCLPPNCTWSCSLTEWRGWSSQDICGPSVYVERSSDPSRAPMEVRKLAVLLWEKEKEMNNQ